MKTTYHGSCHCRSVTFEADIDFDEGTRKCNCTFCWKQRMWKTSRLDPADFRLLSGEDALGDYGKSGDWGEGHHRFCTKCGIATHGDGRMAEMGGRFVLVHVAALDDLPTEVLLAAPIEIIDGLHDDWEHTPAETRHL